MLSQPLLVLSGLLFSGSLARSQQVLPPSQDPWYSSTPAAYQNTQPGQVLKVRHTPGNLTTIAGKNCSDSYQILYRTTDTNYQASWAVTTLFVPAKLAPAPAAHPLLSYQIPYDTANLDGSPSAILYTEAYNVSQGGGPSNFDDFGPLLGRGWYVSVPDYEGPLGGFGLMVQAGHAVVDGIRAVQSLSFGPGKSAPTGLWGYSGGGIASEIAGEVQVQYAPELTLSGIAAGGLVPNFTSGYDYMSGTAFAAIMPQWLTGITSQNKPGRDYLTSRLKDSGPYNKTTFLSVLTLPLATTFGIFLNQNISNYFIGGRSDIFDSPIMQKVIGPTYLGHHGTPTAPLFLYKAIQDQVSPIADVDALVASYCSVAATVQFQRNTLGDHVTEISAGGPGAVNFLIKVLEQGYQPSGCQITNVSLNGTGTFNG